MVAALLDMQDSQVQSLWLENRSLERLLLAELSLLRRCVNGCCQPNTAIWKYHTACDNDETA